MASHHQPRTRGSLSRRSQQSVRPQLAIPCLALLASATIFGCAASPEVWETTVGNDTTQVDCISSQVDNPRTMVFAAAQSAAPVTAFTVDELTEDSYRDMDLSEALQLAMEHSTVLRDVGGVILRTPQLATTRYTSQLQETDPRFGQEAALSAFDAQLAASATFNNNDRLFNNNFFAGGTTSFQQDLNDYEVELSKRTATGSLLALRGITNYDANNAPANTFSSAWQSWVEGEIRQPLLQGGGLEFNRIAGPGGTPGVYNGILIAKVNNDVNNAEFTVALRDFVSNVENAYWDLYFAYRELDARKKAMEQALITWNSRKATEQNTQDLSEESLARLQYFQFKAEVDEALTGRLLQGTQTRNGSTGGTLQTTSGVLTVERRLRLLIGLPASDGSLLRPSEEPTMAQIQFDWPTSMQEAISQRPELARQQLIVKRTEMELLAAKNFLNPRLDAFGRYRFRGFGNDLIADGFQGGTAPASALGNLNTGDYQEWALGMELTVPIGYRQAHAAVANSELLLARARAIQKEQQRDVVSDLSGSFADAARAYVLVQDNLNQYLAAQEYLKALTVRSNQRIDVDVDRLLDAQRRVVEAEIQFFRSRAEYAVALKNIHYEKASLLSYRDLRIRGSASDIAQPLPSGQEIIIDEAGDVSDSTDIPAAAPPVDDTARDDTAVDRDPAEQKQPAADVKETRHAARPGDGTPQTRSQVVNDEATDTSRAVREAGRATTSARQSTGEESVPTPEIKLSSLGGSRASDINRISAITVDDEFANGAVTPISVIEDEPAIGAITPISMARSVSQDQTKSAKQNSSQQSLIEAPPVIGDFTPIPQ